MPDIFKSKHFGVVCLILLLSTAAVYSQVGSFEFLHFDDKLYITENSHVPAGLSAQNVLWAFTTVETELWQPLVWLSFMMDYEIYGLKAGGFHLTNLILHILSTLLLFALMVRMTKALWRSAFVAAFFALLPVHVESVAWVAERKDVLSGFFFMLTLYLYVRYAEKPGWKRYAPVLVAFLLGLMSKSMLVTLPAMLILLDYWPLGRLTNQYAFAVQAPVKASPPNHPHQKGKAVKEKSAAGNASPAVAAGAAQPSPGFLPLWQIGEKLPLFLMSLVIGLVIMTAQNGQNLVSGKALYPIGERLANAFVSYMTYIVNILTPYNLGAFYPFNEHLPVFTVIISAVLFAVLCLAALWAVKRFPFIFVGWFWFAIMLLPVIGIIPLGEHALTDRYTYLAAIGIGFLPAWGLPLIFKTENLRKKILLPAGVVYLAVLGVLAWVQCGYWANDDALFSHTLAVTKDNDLMHYNIGWTYAQKGELEKAREHLQEAIRIDSRDDRYYANLGLVYNNMGDKEKAVYYYTEGLKLNPNNDIIHSNLGATLETTGRKKEARDHYLKAMEINPRLSAPHFNYATLILEEGKIDEAEKELRTAIALKTDYEDARNELAKLLLRQNRIQEGIEQLREVVGINPANVPALYMLGHFLVLTARYEEAIDCYQKAARIEPGNPKAFYNMGVIYSAAGDTASAMKHFRTALEIKPDYPEAQKALRDIQDRMRKS